LHLLTTGIADQLMTVRKKRVASLIVIK